MSDLNINWVPNFGVIYTWIAMDKNGKIAVMVNNCFGDLPRVLLKIDNIELYLDKLSEFLWEESEVYDNYPLNKNGQMILDLYSKWRYKNIEKNILIQELKEDLDSNKNYSEVNFCVNKGLFVYHAIEGSREGEDYPIGYNGNTVMGDYFRFLVPTIYGTVQDFPEDLRQYIVVSNELDFTNDRIVRNDQINKYFYHLWV